VALLESQRRQLHRLPIVDGSFGKSDRFALHGIPQALSPDLTAAQRRQWHFIPIADATIDVGDRYTLHGISQPLDTTGPLIDILEVSWSIDPTWDALLLPQSNDGFIGVGLQSIGFAFLGSAVSATVSVGIGAHSLSFTDQARSMGITGVPRYLSFTESSANNRTTIIGASKGVVFSSLGRSVSIQGANRIIDIS